MENSETLKHLCFDEKGALKPKNECRAVIINHLILDEMMDIDESEDLADKTLRELNLWPEEKKEDPAPPETAAEA